MKRKKVKARLSIAAYGILCLFAIILFLLSQSDWLPNNWADVLSGLSVELLGVVIVFFIAQSFFIWNEETEVRNEKLDLFLSKSEQDNYSSVFVIDRASKANDKFYSYFNERIRNARHDIYLTGDGFESEDSKSFAIDYIKANIDALKNNVNIVRLQTESSISEYWSIHLKHLLKYPNFKLFITDSAWSKGSLCSIDCTDEINNLTEYMLSVPRASGIKKMSLAGLAVFVRNNQELSKDVMEMICRRCQNSELSTSITLENFSDHFTINSKND